MVGVLRERAPLTWAAIQNNLGGALLRLGERESGTSRLEEALAAFRCALKEWTRAEASYYCEGARTNLVLVLAEIERRSQ